MLRPMTWFSIKLCCTDLETRMLPSNSLHLNNRLHSPDMADSIVLWPSPEISATTVIYRKDFFCC